MFIHRKHYVMLEFCMCSTANNIHIMIDFGIESVWSRYTYQRKGKEHWISSMVFRFLHVKVWWIFYEDLVLQLTSLCHPSNIQVHIGSPLLTGLQSRDKTVTQVTFSLFQWNFHLLSLPQEYISGTHFVWTYQIVCVQVTNKKSEWTWASSYEQTTGRNILFV